MITGSTLERVASADWVEEKREQLADLPKPRRGDNNPSDAQQELQAGLARAAEGLMEELPPDKPRTTRRKSLIEGRLLAMSVQLTTQDRTKSFASEYVPTPPSYMRGDEKDRPDLGPRWSFVRVVALSQETFEKRLFVPLLAGGLALKGKTGEADYIGIESGSDSFITPRPLDIDFSHAFRLVKTDGTATFPHGAQARENVTDLVEGLHAIAVSATTDPADLHPDPLLFFD